MNITIWNMYLTGITIKVITCVTVGSFPSWIAAQYTDTIKSVTARDAVWSTFLWTIYTIRAGRTCLWLNKMKCQWFFFLFIYPFSKIISWFIIHAIIFTFITLASMKSSVTSVWAGSGHVMTLFSTDAVTTASFTFQAVLISVTFYYKSNIK